MKYAVDEEEAAPRRGGLGRGTRAERETSGDTEITLGTRSLLGIFFGLVLICAVFFGLGYSVGRVSSPKGADTASTGPADALPDDSHVAKPSAQQGLTAPATDAAAGSETPATDGTSATAPAPAPGTPETVTVPAGASGTAAPTTAATATQPTVFPSQERAPAPTAAKTATTPVGASFPAVQQVPEKSAGTLMVQVAAISVPQDAEILVAALKRHGYNAVIRHEPADALLHVQVGPFATKADAEAMRGRLLADGYNAVIK